MTHPILRLYEALEAGINGDGLRDLFTTDARTVEHPNLLAPGGAVRTLDNMIAGWAAGAEMFLGEKYEVHDIRDAGVFTIVRLTWTATVGRDAGPFRAGRQLTSHMAQFVRLEHDRIASIETYDCYEPF